MTLEVHTVDLKARDGISPVLRQVATAASDMGRSTGEAVRRFNFDRAAFTGGMRELQGALSDWSRAAAEEEAGLQRLAQSVENTGASYDNFGRRIDQAIARGESLAFQDDKVVDSLSRLTTVTGDTNVALDKMGLVMDFARARGIDLSTSADIIGKVYEGNLGILSRYGIAVQEGATATEALALLQQRVSGQASAYSATTAGDIDRYRNKLDNLTESIGAHTGALQTFLALMPGMNAAYSTLAALVGGVGGVGSLLKYGGPLALLAGGGMLAYGYSQDTIGATTTNTAANQFFAEAAGLFNLLTPGSIMDQTRYYRNMDRNETGSFVLDMFRAPGESETKAVDRLNEALGNPGIRAGEPFNYEWGDLYKYIETQAASLGLTVPQFIERATTANPAFMVDPVTGVSMRRSEYSAFATKRGTYYGTMGAGLSSPYAGGTLPGPYDPYDGRTRYDAGPYIGIPGYYVNEYAASVGSMAAMGTASYMATPGYAEAQRAATDRQLREQYGAFGGVVGGINSQHDVTTAFNAAQGNILGQESVYGGQISEYTQQMNALTGAYEILQQRQADGVKLSQDEQELLKNYPELYERVSGGVEDATVQQGLLAAAYIENMGINDQMNQTLAGTNDVLGTLTDVLALYIATLEGVPSEVKTEIHLNTDPALAALAEFLNMIPGSFTVPMYVSGSDINAFLGGGQGRMHGGMIETAFTGRMTGGRYTLVGEGGPEIVSLPGGSLVTPAGASRAAMQGGSGGITINGPIHVYANDAMEFADSMRAMRYAEARA